MLMMYWHNNASTPIQGTIELLILKNSHTSELECENNIKITKMKKKCKIK